MVANTNLADVLASIYLGFEADAREAGAAMDDMLAASDVLEGGLRDVLRGGRALLRASWALNRACWRLRKAVAWSSLLDSER